jgi:hypothetical protein
MSHKAIAVLTGEGFDTIIRSGGTSYWHLSRSRARGCGFVVCTRNANAPWVEGSEPHRSAFLIGKIKDVTPAPDQEGRFRIQLSEYSRVEIPGVWKGNQNPVMYETLEALGIDPSALKWEHMPKESEIPKSMRDINRPAPASALTMAEAKKGLALTFGVSPDAIEITIRG